MTRVAGCLQLLSEVFPGKKQAFAFPVALLVLGRDRWVDGLPLLGHLLLLLLHGLTLPAACHLRILPCEEGCWLIASAAETSARKEQALAFPVALLPVGRDRCKGSLDGYALDTE